ncbi:hypothetical protein BH24PSE2_BH24PSE2_16480 [soil metagenome]
MPLRIDNAVSPRLVAAVGVLYALAAMALVGLPLPPAARLALFVALAAHAYNLFRKLYLRAGARSIVRIELDDRGEWRLTDGAGGTFAARLAPGSRATLPLIALRWRDRRGGRHCAYLAADVIDREALRRLRVRLRLGAGTIHRSQTGQMGDLSTKQPFSTRTFR